MRMEKKNSINLFTRCFLGLKKGSRGAWEVLLFPSPPLKKKKRKIILVVVDIFNKKHHFIVSCYFKNPDGLIGTSITSVSWLKAWDLESIFFYLQLL